MLIIVSAFLFAEKFVAKTILQKEVSYTDFTSYYIAAYNQRLGISPYSTMEIGDNYIRNNVPPEELAMMGINFGIPERFAYTYPPFFTFMLSPITYFKYETANRIWQGLNLLFLFGVIITVLKILGEFRLSPVMGLVLVLFLGSMPSYESFSLGQVNYLVILLCLLSLKLDREGKAVLSALCLAAASIIKVTPAVLILYFLFFSKDRRYFIRYAGFSAGFLIVSGLAVGFGEFFRYLTYILPKLSGSYLLENNKSLVSLVSRVFKSNPMVEPLYISNAMVVFFTGLILLGFTALAGYKLFRARKVKGENVKLADFSFVLMLMLVIQTLLEIHHLMYAFLPLCVFVLFWKYDIKVKTVVFVLLLMMLNTRGWNAMQVFGVSWWVIFLTAPQVIGLIILFILTGSMLNTKVIKK